MDAYGALTARAYAAYRPPLHQLILAGLLDRCYARGLDYGCGTGQSAHALADYCKEVVAVDGSPAMLERALPGARIAYRLQEGEDIAVSGKVFDLITLAGVLPYCKSQAFLDRLVGVCRPGARIVIYDFNCELLSGDDWLYPPPRPVASYDHAIDFTGLQLRGMQSIDKRHQTLSLELTAQQLTYLALADSDNVAAFARELGHDKLVPRVRKRLQEYYGIEDTYPVAFTTYSTQYQLNSA